MKSSRPWSRLLISGVILLSCLSLIAPAPFRASAQANETPESRALDGLIGNAIKADQPGAAVLVTRQGRILVRKGYGLADLELKVPIEPDMIFRLGSVTKQFTAVAILMLEEEGKLAVQDPITKFFPDYPTRGHTITVEHLLTHTSGIRSYTSMPEWRPLWRKDFPVTELVSFFKDQPMDFTPGENWLYDNSGYILLGAIIEKASGSSYEEFLQQRIFTPLGMSSSCYDHTEQILPRRVKGYQRTPQGFENAPYLSMTQPYAAGSLASSVDDLARWNAALWSNKLLKRESLNKAHRPVTLKDGRATGYGYGWNISSYAGHRTVEHGGGIHGFATYTISLPEDEIYVVVLSNGSAGPQLTPERVAMQMAALALGQPVIEPQPVPLQVEQLERLVGTYAIDDKEEGIISREGNQLFSQRSGGARNPIHPLSEKEFFFPNSLSRLVFTLDSAGQASRVELRPRVGMIETARRRQKVPSGERQEVPVGAAILARYAGVYELAPNFLLTVSLEEGKLMTQATGQAKVQVYPESETKFFLKVTDAQIEFVQDGSGAVTGLKLYQGGRILPAKKIK